MTFILRIVTLWIFAVCGYECSYDHSLPEYVLAKGHYGNVIEGNFFFAYEYCRSVGMKVVTPNTKEKNDALLEFLKDIGSVWTSGNDLSREGRFVWLTQGALLSYTDWDPNQPDNMGDVEHCVEIRKEFGWKWNDNKCNIEYPIVCENEPVVRPQAIKCF